MKGKLLVALLGSFAASVAMADVSTVMSVDIQGPSGNTQKREKKIDRTSLDFLCVAVIQKLKNDFPLPGQRNPFPEDSRLSGGKVKSVGTENGFLRQITLILKTGKRRP